ncbi:MAG: UvrD-helicase domain-containing protein [Sandaracinaceae bacterium]
MSDSHDDPRDGNDAAPVVLVPRPAILDAIDTGEHAVIEASAGTGKTFTLEHLIVELVVERAIPLEQILVVTFTEKATFEMRERVRATLARVAAAEPSDAPPPEGSVWRIDDVKRQRVRDALTAFDRAPISTIHAFCQRVLTEHAFECGRGLEQRTVESREAFGIACREELRVALADHDPLAPLVRFALASFGPDRLENALFKWASERAPIEPRFDLGEVAAILAKLPGRLALNEGGPLARMLARGLTGNPKKAVPEMLKELAPIAERFTALGASPGPSAVLSTLLEVWEWANAPAFGGKTRLRYVAHYLARARERGLHPLGAAFAKLEAMAPSPMAVLIGELSPRIAARSAARKAELSELDFDDMLTALRDALAREPGGARLVAELRRRFRVALVDEFQDTDGVQWEIFRRIFFEEGTEQRLVVIGDPKQAIYGFRNADVHTYVAAREAIRARGGAVVPLTVSFRSSPKMIEATNRIFAEGFFSGLNSYPHPVRAGRPERRAVDASGAELVPIVLLHLVGRPELRAAAVRRTLARTVASEIEALLAGSLQKDEGEPGGPKPLRASDIHVLCRSGTDAEDIARELSDARIPCSLYRQEGLFQSLAARHILDVLRAIALPNDVGLRMRAWLTPFFAVPLESLEAARRAAPDHPLLAPLYAWHRLADAHRFEALFTSVLEDSGIARRELFAAVDARALTDYAHLFEVLLEEAHRGQRSLPQLIARLAAFMEGRERPDAESGNVHRPETDRDAVQVLTMHKSKGLEAEVVFLVGGLTEPPEDSLAPRVVHIGSERRARLGPVTDEAKEALEIERREEAERLLYVALTRAKRRLVLPYFGPPPPGTPSVEGASYELTGEPELDDGERPQLGWAFARRAEPEVAREYALRRLEGPYRVLNERLRQMVERGALTEHPTLYARREIDVLDREPPRTAVPSRTRGDWDPPASLLVEPAPTPERFARWTRERAGFEITSYTRMKRMRARLTAPALTPWEGGAAGSDDAIREERADPSVASEEDDLPGGTEVGVFLHAVLEHAPFERVRALEGDDAWLEDEELAELLRRAMAEHRMDPRHEAAFARLLTRALRAPWKLPDGARLDAGLASIERKAAELPFLMPIPERSHPALGEAHTAVQARAIERGFIKGIIDLVIEHEGRYTIIDYKSDRLARYDEDAVRAHVEESYLAQARLYVVGGLRALGIETRGDYDARFGGLAYLFVRGMDGEAGGVHTARPTWDEVVAWERALLSPRPWGYPLPERRSHDG